ncbi:hypothetical protein SKAU_G00187810 [Synaphobranchus kaupii]|uniref:Uncharacterized protein n=1 Tax=Synaphobranchus kaupii TaxID=118154 RepID=A0A9Q1IUW7_SYNKA|nr:hypothetical protein SKAU_G00187810 [Synaphobranchus kaupii]
MAQTTHLQATRAAQYVPQGGRESARAHEVFAQEGEAFSANGNVQHNGAAEPSAAAHLADVRSIYGHIFSLYRQTKLARGGSLRSLEVPPAPVRSVTLHSCGLEHIVPPARTEEPSRSLRAPSARITTGAL